MRREPTPQEEALWEKLRAKRLDGWKFRRQSPLGPFVPDFCCPAAKLIIELDGSQHCEQEHYDAARTSFLEREGYRVLRFWNHDVDRNLEGVLRLIQEALSGVLMALIGRERTGRGDYLDIAMFDSLLPWCAHTAGSAIAGGESPRSDDQRSLGGAAFYQVYRTADGRHIVLGGREEKFVASLLTALGRPDLIPLGSADAGEPQAPLTAFLRDTFAGRTRAEWVDWFADKDVAFAPVLDFREALDQPHVAERRLWIEQDGAHHIAPAIRFAGEAG